MTTYIPAIGALVFGALLASLLLASRAYGRRQKRLNAQAVLEHHAAKTASDTGRPEPWIDDEMSGRWTQRWDASDAAFWGKWGAFADRNFEREDLIEHRRLVAWATWGTKADHAALGCLPDEGEWCDRTREWTAFEVAELHAMLAVGEVELYAERASRR